MRLKHIKNADLIINESPYLVKNPIDYCGKWKSVFNNNNPIEIEIGSGKGNFIITKAINNPDINYIGIEKYDSPLVNAVKRLEEVEIKNLKLICFDAINIDTILDKEIDKLYLTFSDPWPKKRHEKRRLSSKQFITKYDEIFKNDCLIELKTDNDDFFEYSVTSFTQNGYNIVTLDTCFDDEIKTEYESKFFSLGKNINHVIVKK